MNKRLNKKQSIKKQTTKIYNCFGSGEVVLKGPGDLDPTYKGNYSSTLLSARDNNIQNV